MVISRDFNPTPQQFVKTNSFISHGGRRVRGGTSRSPLAVKDEGDPELEVQQHRFGVMILQASS